jgi:hypothetical protein
LQGENTINQMAFCFTKSRTLFCLSIQIGIIFSLSSCSNSKKDLEQFNQKAIHKEEIKNVVSYLSQKGVMKARLTAPLLIRFTSDSTRVEFPNGLHTEFFQENGDLNLKVDTTIVESHIYSKYGRYTEFNNKVFLKDSVVCYNQIKKDTLWCDELWWDQNLQRIHTWGKFRFKTHDGQNMYGNGSDAGFNARQDLSEYTLYKSKGTMMAPAGAFPTN